MTETIKLKGIVMEDFTNYKVPSLFMITTTCNWKCCMEGGFDVKICQNSELATAEIKEYKLESIYNAYITNPITKSVVIGGLEPFMQFDEIFNLIQYFRNNKCEDEFIIYTGYYENELECQINKLKQFKNIIIKFGRYVPNNTPHFDDVLGINLISDNQYAMKIS